MMQVKTIFSISICFHLYAIINSIEFDKTVLQGLEILGGRENRVFYKCPGKPYCPLFSIRCNNDGNCPAHTPVCCQAQNNIRCCCKGVPVTTTTTATTTITTTQQPLAPMCPSSAIPPTCLSTDVCENASSDCYAAERCCRISATITAPCCVSNTRP